MPQSKHDPEAVDGYLASLPDAERDTLQELRQLIEATVPEVEEVRLMEGLALATDHPEAVDDSHAA